MLAMILITCASSHQEQQASALFMSGTCTPTLFIGVSGQLQQQLEAPCVTSYCACSGVSNVSSEAAVAAAASAAAAEYAAAHTPGAVASINSTTAPSSTGNALCAVFGQKSREQRTGLLTQGLHVT